MTAGAQGSRGRVLVIGGSLVGLIAGAVFTAAIIFSATPSTACNTVTTAKLTIAPPAAIRAHPIAFSVANCCATNKSAAAINATPASCVKWLATHR